MPRSRLTSTTFFLVSRNNSSTRNDCRLCNLPATRKLSNTLRYSTKVEASAARYFCRKVSAHLGKSARGVAGALMGRYRLKGFGGCGLGSSARLFHGVELGFGCDTGAALAQLVQAHVQVRFAQLRAQAGLGHLALDVVTHGAQGLHFGIDRQTVELALDFESRLGAVHLRQHAVFFGLEFVDLGLDLRE